MPEPQATFSESWHRVANQKVWLHPSVRVSPNVELVRYEDDPDPVHFPGRRQDSILRFTFFWTF